MNKRHQYGPYVAVGVTAFAVIAAALLLFFTLFHLSALRAFFGTLAHILRPIFLGMIFAFLLLPVHRGIFGFLVAMTPEKRLKNKGDVQFLNVLAIILSLLLAVFLLYLLLAMALPQVYLSIVGLVNAFPEVRGIVHLRFKYVIVRIEYGNIFVVDLRVMCDKGLHQQRKHPVCQDTGYCASRARVHDVHLEVDQHHVHGLLQFHAVRDLQQGQQTFRTCGHFSF